MLIRTPATSQAKESDVTPEHLFRARRRFLQLGAGSALGWAAASSLAVGGLLAPVSAKAREVEMLKAAKWPGSTDEPPTTLKDITTYNNFYELSTSKDGPQHETENFKPAPWSVEVSGLVNNPGTYDVWDLVKKDQLEQRIYRHRCVEAWSMVVPWVGVSLADVVKRLDPQTSAKYIAFETLLDPEQLPGQNRQVLQWPYVEGLRLDEALNPLAMLVVGVYDQTLPPQNGAPIRLVVPWKYGFKAIKSIVRISFTEEEPPTSWNRSAPREYGFYANVNPGVNHPRWSQAKERRIGDFLRRKTEMFNGYGDEVAGLYAGMDLTRSF